MSEYYVKYIYLVRATRACCFSKEPTKLFSASDDKTARYWDLPTGKEIARVKSHKVGLFSYVCENNWKLY